tara:strand:+ start:175 stop:450 length:276 start_codon:yes stop_codon:yes gene_type:complete
MKTIRGKEMVTLEERLRRDMLFYESLSEDKQRIPSSSVRYDIERVKDAIKEIVDYYAFVDDTRNETNIPTNGEDKVAGRKIHYGSDDVTSN